MNSVQIGLLGEVRRVRHTSNSDGALGLEYLSAKDDPRNDNSQEESEQIRPKQFGFLSN